MGLIVAEDSALLFLDRVMLLIFELAFDRNNRRESGNGGSLVLDTREEVERVRQVRLGVVLVSLPGRLGASTGKGEVRAACISLLETKTVILAYMREVTKPLIWKTRLSMRGLLTEDSRGCFIDIS